MEIHYRAEPRDVEVSAPGLQDRVERRHERLASAVELAEQPALVGVEGGGQPFARAYHVAAQLRAFRAGKIDVLVTGVTLCTLVPG